MHTRGYEAGKASEHNVQFSPRAAEVELRVSTSVTFQVTNDSIKSVQHADLKMQDALTDNPKLHWLLRTIE